MAFDDDNFLLGMEGGCPSHGDEGMCECSVCGVEFCVRCFPGGGGLCPDCFEAQEEVDDAEGGGEGGRADPETERLLAEADELPADLCSQDEDDR